MSAIGSSGFLENAYGIFAGKTTAFELQVQRLMKAGVTEANARANVLLTQIIDFAHR